MIRVLLLCLALVAAQAAWAANTVAWKRTSGQANCSLAQDRCCVFEFTTTTNESEYLAVGGFTVSIQFEPDNTGSNTAAQASLYACGTKDGDADGTVDTNSCKAYKWDSDGDGIVDTNQFDFASDMKQALENVSIAGFLYIDPDTAPAGGDEASVTVCASPEDRG